MALREFDESVLLVVCQIISSKADHKPKEAFARRFPGKGDKVRVTRCANPWSCWRVRDIYRSTRQAAA